VQAKYLGYLILLDLFIIISFGEEYKFEATHSAVFSNLLPFHFSSAQIFSSAPCFQIPSVLLGFMKSLIM
jgi:hypothetical protein